jgi:hypothetical protein
LTFLGHDRIAELQQHNENTQQNGGAKLCVR